MTNGPDEFDIFIFEAMAHAAAENLASRSTFPIIDTEREDTTVIQDFGVVEVHHQWTDQTHALPVRFALGSSGFQLHIGEYNFSDSQIDVLRRAVVAYTRNANAQRTPP